MKKSQPSDKRPQIVVLRKSHRWLKIHHLMAILKATSVIEGTKRLSVNNRAILLRKVKLLKKMMMMNHCFISSVGNPSLKIMRLWKSKTRPIIHLNLN